MTATDEIEAKGCRWARSADGRIIEYSVNGSTRPDARTVVAGYFAATEIHESWAQAFDALNIRKIDISLPGLGLSSLHPGRRVADWPRDDVEPVLAAEGVTDFFVYGVSYGTIHALAVAQHFGPERVLSMGLRVPYFGLPLSEELGLPDGQPRFPTTQALLDNTAEVASWRAAMGAMLGIQDPDAAPVEMPDALKQVQEATGDAAEQSYIALNRDYPGLILPSASSFNSVDAMLYMMAQDVALDLPGVDPRNVALSGDRVVVWYAADDEDCPGSHGEWLAQHFGAKTRVFEGYGHIGGAMIDHPQFLAELVGDGK